MTLEEMRKYCLALPGTTEDVKWEDHLCFNVGGKMYCITMFSEPIGLNLKVADEEFEEIIQRNGFSPAAYLARYKWIRLEDTDMISDDELKRLLKQSYELVKSKLPKKKIREIEGGK